jgi:hypothetical protein
VDPGEKVMARYLHESQGQRFEIDIDGLTLTTGDTARCFVARIRNITGETPVAVLEKGTSRRDFFGQTEPWALKNARDLLDWGCWIVENEPVRTMMELHCLGRSA